MFNVVHVHIEKQVKHKPTTKYTLWQFLFQNEWMNERMNEWTNEPINHTHIQLTPLQAFQWPELHEAPKLPIILSIYIYKFYHHYFPNYYPILTLPVNFPTYTDTRKCLIIMQQQLEYIKLWQYAIMVGKENKWQDFIDYFYLIKQYNFNEQVFTININTTDIHI